MVMDISSEKEAHGQLEFLAKNNELTGLPNRMSFYEKLNELINDPRTPSFAIIHMELNDIPWITDQLGYQISDLVLKKIAQQLISLLPESSYLANINHDNFIFILANYSSKDDVEELAKQIIKRVRAQIKVEEYELYVTASIGISYYPENGLDRLSILEKAHVALERAKNIGKNNFKVYSLNRDIDSHKKYILELDLRHAIRNEELEIYYQPQVNPENDEIESAEALIRWNHKDWGIISPGEFIPLAEQKHLIHELGAWVIQRVCTQVKEWLEKDI